MADRVTGAVASEAVLVRVDDVVPSTARIIWAPDARGFAVYVAVRHDPEALGDPECEYDEWALAASGWHRGPQRPHRRGDILVSALADADPARRRQAVARVREMCLRGNLRLPWADGRADGLALGARVGDGVDCAAWLGGAVRCRTVWLGESEESQRTADLYGPGNPWSARASVAWNGRFLFVRVVFECWWDTFSDHGLACFPAELRVRAGPPSGNHKTVDVHLAARDDGSSLAQMLSAGSDWGRVESGVAWAAYRRPYRGFTGARDLLRAGRDGAILCVAIPWSALSATRTPVEGDLVPFALTASAEIDGLGAVYGWMDDTRPPMPPDDMGRLVLLDDVGASDRRAPSPSP